MDEKNLKVLWDRTTNWIIMNITNILRYLLDTYGDISPQKLANIREHVKKMNFDPTEPKVYDRFIVAFFGLLQIDDTINSLSY